MNRYLQKMKWQDRITADPKVVVGKPAIKGARLTIEFVVDLFAAGSLDP